MTLEPRLLFLMVFAVVYIVLFAVNPSLTLKNSFGAPLQLIIESVNIFIHFLLKKLRNSNDKLRHYDGSDQDFINEYGHEAYSALMSTKIIKVDLGNHTSLPNYNPPLPPKFKYGGLAPQKVEIPVDLNAELEKSKIIQFKYEV
jgi:uncharacterized membrane protein YagU involved in acid resistance